MPAELINMANSLTPLMRVGYCFPTCGVKTLLFGTAPTFPCWGHWGPLSQDLEETGTPKGRSCTSTHDSTHGLHGVL